MNKELIPLLEENERRKKEIFGPYDPTTGIGCAGFQDRVKVCIPDFFIPEMYVPKECMDTFLYKLVIQHGSIQNFIHNYQNKEYTDTRAQLVAMELCKIRMREDPEFAMFLCDKIIDKKTGEMIPFRLNYPQRKLIQLFEKIRKEGRAIRVIVLKARQWGGSTLTQLYIKWMQTFRHNGWNAIVLAQVKATSKKIKAMYRQSLANQPGWTLGYPGSKLQFSPYENSADDFIVTDGLRSLRTSTLTVASFDNFDNVRGSNFHCAHYSEVAYWKASPEHNPEGVISSVSGSIRNQPDNIEVFESTGKGASGFFYEMCQNAISKSSAYEFFFVPFYIIENDMELVEDPVTFAKWLWNNRESEHITKKYKESGKFYWRMWKLGATFEAINWYRNYRPKFLTHAYMASEAPIDHVEAFRNSGNLIFDPYIIDQFEESNRDDNYQYADISMPDERTHHAIQQAKLTFRERQTELKIWKIPNNHILKVRNRYVVSLDIGGASPNSDYSVMTVIDRFGLVPGVYGKQTVVARWRGHLRHDKLAWKAAALAHIYSDAMLVIESNTADREKYSNTEGDHFGTIIEEISKYYPNLYRRNSEPDKVVDKLEMRFGFHTNTKTKQWVIDNLIEAVDDQLYEEPDQDMFNELRIYERKDDGSMGNIEGKGNHDDILMSTAIALWVSDHDMKTPSWIQQDKKRDIRKIPLSEATI